MRSLAVFRYVLGTLVALTLTRYVGDVQAATFTVNSLADTDDGTCGPAPGGCTLHEAMAAAVATPGRDTIAFDATVFPPGSPGLISLFQVTPVIVDPAGTALDGSGAGVIIEPANQIGPSPDPIVFASAPGAPLANVTVANVTVRNFVGSGIVICGGEFPICDQDVSGTVVQNVLARGNGAAGIKVAGRNVSKTRIVGSVASHNDSVGIGIEASQSAKATRIEDCTVGDNGMAASGEPGIRLHAIAGVADTIVTGTIAANSGTQGIEVSSDAGIVKTKMSNVTALGNGHSGIAIFANGDLSSTMIAGATASDNAAQGIDISGEQLVAGTTLKEVVANRNGARGIELNASLHLLGTKITNAKAARNGTDGISAFSLVDASGTQITRSIVTTNGGFGVMLTGNGNTVKSVRADANGSGIYLGAPGGSSKIEKCTAHANNGSAPGTDGTGIKVALGSTGNVVQKNAAFVNDGANLADDNPNCDGNVWKKNIFDGAATACVQ